MEELGLPELTSEQTQTLCTTAEEAARKYVLSKASSKNLEKLDICAEVEGTKPVKLTVDVDIELLPSVKVISAKKLVDEAVKVAFDAAEKYLRDLKCPSTK